MGNDNLITLTRVILSTKCGDPECPVCGNGPATSDEDYEATLRAVRDLMSEE